MSSDSRPNESEPLRRGDWCAPSPTDLRSPCPIVNALANHGHIARDGRNIRRSEMRSAMRELGVASTVRTALAYGAWLEHYDSPPRGFWAFIQNPFAYFLRGLGLRNLGQRDSSGAACLNLDQLGRHGAVEHDVSLSRCDAAQGDQTTPQKDLIADLVASSSDGKMITTEDLARFRVQRTEQQRRDNPRLEYGPVQHQMACAESAFVQKLFGYENRSDSVPVPYVKALFEEERLPINEGWKRRVWWLLGFVELMSQAEILKKCVTSIDSRAGSQ